jgi:tetratricopeptide (TPR) repeat protein
MATAVLAGDASAEEPAPLPPPPTAPAERALVLHDEARALYRDGRYRAAIVKLEAALALDPNGKELVYNLALSHERLAEFEAAARYYRSYLVMEQDEKVKQRVEATLRRIEGAEEEAAAHARRDGKAPPRPKARCFAGATQRPSDLRPWVGVTAGLAGTAMVTGFVLGISAAMMNPEGGRTGAVISPEEMAADARRVHTRIVAADVSFAIAALSGATALVLHFSGTPAAPTARGPRPPPRVDMALGLGQGLVRVRF